MSENNIDHLSFALSAFELMLHHMEMAHALSSNRPYPQAIRECEQLASCLPAVAQLRSVLIELTEE